MKQEMGGITQNKQIRLVFIEVFKLNVNIEFT